MKKIISIALSCLLLISSTGLTYATHFCGGHAVESKIMVGEKDLGCQMAVAETTSDCDVISRPTACCENDYASIDLEDNFNIQLVDNLHFEVFVQSTFEFTSARSLVIGNIRNYHDYVPPPLIDDYQVHYSTFLI